MELEPSEELRGLGGAGIPGELQTRVTHCSKRSRQRNNMEEASRDIVLRGWWSGVSCTYIDARHICWAGAVSFLPIPRGGLGPRNHKSRPVSYLKENAKRRPSQTLSDSVLTTGWHRQALLNLWATQTGSQWKTLSHWATLCAVCCYLSPYLSDKCLSWESSKSNWKPAKKKQWGSSCGHCLLLHAVPPWPCLSQSVSLPQNNSPKDIHVLMNLWLCYLAQQKKCCRCD